VDKGRNFKWITVFRQRRVILLVQKRRGFWQDVLEMMSCVACVLCWK